MIDIREAREEDRGQIIELARLSFNPPTNWHRKLAPALSLDGFLCGFEEGKFVSMARCIPLRQWFGGGSVPMAGISLVAAVPERRGAGTASRVVRAMLQKGHDSGALISTLYPSRAAVYRRMGFEYSGLRTQYKVPLTVLPAGSGIEVEELSGVEAIGPLQECYREFAALHMGPVETRDHDWWTTRVLRAWADEPTRAIVVRGEKGVEGYAAFTLESLGDGWGYDISCTHLVALNQKAVFGLLDYFRRYRGLGQRLAWYGPPNEPIGLLMETGAETLAPARCLRFMTRLLDVPGALEARGYPQVEGTATISVEDEMFPQNRGPFRIVAQDRQVSVERTDGPEKRPIPIGALSSLYTGFLSVTDLIRLGQFDSSDPDLPFLASLFESSPPWMFDMF